MELGRSSLSGPWLSFGGKGLVSAPSLSHDGFDKPTSTFLFLKASSLTSNISDEEYLEHALLLIIKFV
jgi:hypothetical protein